MLFYSCQRCCFSAATSWCGTACCVASASLQAMPYLFMKPVVLQHSCCCDASCGIQQQQSTAHTLSGTALKVKGVVCHAERLLCLAPPLAPGTSAVTGDNILTAFEAPWHVLAMSLPGGVCSCGLFGFHLGKTCTCNDRTCLRVRFLGHIW